MADLMDLARQEAEADLESREAQPDLPDTELDGQLPEVDPAPTDEPAPEPDFASRLNTALDLVIEREQRAAAPAAPVASTPAPTPAWVDPYDRPENIEQYNELASRGVYDPAANLELKRLTNSWDAEIRQRELYDYGQYQQAQQQAPQVIRGFATEAAQAHRGYIAEEEFETVANDTAQAFGGTTAQFAQLMNQFPFLRTLVTEAAVGRKTLRGGLRGSATQPPVSTRGPSRAPAPNRPQRDARAVPINELTDSEYISDAIQDDEALKRFAGRKK